MIEEEIMEKLQQGYTPKELIEMGYKKSTVYKVYDKIRTLITPVTKSSWHIKNIQMNERCLPGEEIFISFYFENAEEKDLYLYRIGIQPEWLVSKNLWYSQDVKELVKPRQGRYITINIPVPENLSLGEYELLFGVEAQYLPATSYEQQIISTEWSNPLILHVKRPYTGLKIFISHSTKNMYIVRQLEKHLDEQGIVPIIAEDNVEPGKNIRKKFEEEISSCNIFLALLTEEGVRSEWVKYETNYAARLRKPLILLKEEGVELNTKLEWISFSRYDKPEIILAKVMGAVDQIVKKGMFNISGETLGWALLAFIVGLALGGGRR